MAEFFGEYGEFEPRTVLLLIIADQLVRAEEAQKVDLGLQVFAGRGEADESIDHIRGRIEERAETINFLSMVLRYYNLVHETINAPTMPNPEPEL
jgi:hypothetical protein